MFEVIKSYLIDNTELIVEILEELGFHDVNDRKKDRITCALPDGDNYTSVVIYKNTLITRIHSRTDFKYEVQDFISLVAYIVGSTPSAVSYLCGYLGLDESDVQFKQSESLKLLKKYKTKDKTTNHDPPINEDLLRRNKKYIVQEWVEEGISEEAQIEFEVYIDVKYKRWGFPLRDFDGNLVGFNGRTYVKDFEILRIPKYFKTTKYPMLFNVHRAKEHIKELDEVIIVESEKSVMKLWDMDMKNVVALGTSNMCMETERQILSLKCKNIVFAFDKDRSYDDVVSQLGNLKFKNCYVMIDEDDLLGEKDAPCDTGFLNWVILYEKRKKVK